MPLDTAMSVMSCLEFLLWAAVGYFFWSKGLHKRFPAMSTYVGLRLGSMPILLLLFHGQSRHWFNDYCFLMYFVAYWTVYVASAITLYFVCVEIFHAVLAPFKGLTRLGTIIFRWIALVSTIVSLLPVLSMHTSVLMVTGVAFGLMRSVSILELCLLAFLCLCMNALKLSPRDLTFGLALGFGMMSSSDFIAGALLSGNHSLTSPLQFAYEGTVLVVLGVWVAYIALPEPARKPVVMPANSTIYRWNEIAAALGHGTQVAVQQPANSFFLTDVEKVVDKVLTRSNLQSGESKS
ncbi:MAG TPA: hypothetical protein VFU68_06595 [Terracidiphilus sp.]|nr:hypothetical protein [Terracidiphilus sp.]